MNKVTEMLDTLDEYQSQRDAAMLEKQAVIDSIFTPEIKAQLEAVELEFFSQTAAVEANITAITEEVKALVITCQETVKGAHLMAVYSKPRVTWDNKGLDAFATVHPEIEKYRKVGEPSVSIRKA